MGYRTKVDWCDSTWNPVTGCLHGCDYCYARKIAYRFGSVGYETNTESGYDCDFYDGTGENHVLNHPSQRTWKSGKITQAPYPFCFDPTFHRYKLDEPQHWKKPRNIFVCSMADLFGDWVPDEWIQEVFAACEKAPQHRYLFLTKNPKRYIELAEKGLLVAKDNFWYGSTVASPEMPFFFHDEVNTFVSIEPILEPFTDLIDDGIQPATRCNWIIVGAETGGRRNKTVPEKEWISEIVEASKMTNTPLFMKDSLRGIMGNDFIQQFPWEV